MKKNTTAIIIVFVLLVLVITAFVWWENTHGVAKHFGPLQKVTLQLKWLHQAQFAGFYAAAQQGFYKDEGLDVSIIQVGDDLSSAAVVDRVAKGDIQFGVAGGEQVIEARAKNENVKAIAVIYQQSPVGLVSKRKAGIPDLKGLIGKTTGVWQGQDTHIVYRAMLNSAGINSNKIKEIVIPSGVGYLINDAIDSQMMYLINEGLEAKERGYDLSIIYPEDYNIQFYGDTLVASDSLVEQNPNLVGRFVRASLKGWNWAIAYPEEAGSLTLNYESRSTKAHEVSMMKESLPFIYTGKGDIGSMASSTWDQMEKILLKGRIISTRVPLEDIFTTKFLQP